MKLKGHNHSISSSGSEKRTSSDNHQSCGADAGAPEHHTVNNSNSNNHHNEQPNQKQKQQQQQPLYGNRVYKRQKTDEASAHSQSLFDKLNPADPVHAQRMATRQKAIQKGKNTAGYDAYVQQVPKHQRRPRSMETPSTPDHTLDISAKRWLGMVKAWRVALHKYDPDDLVNTSASSTLTLSSSVKAPKHASVATAATAAPTSATHQLTTTPSKSSRSSNDNNNNLQVMFGTAPQAGAAAAAVVLTGEVALEDTTPVSMASPGESIANNSSPLFCGASRNALDFDAGEDSDDDIL